MADAIEILGQFRLPVDGDAGERAEQEDGQRADDGAEQQAGLDRTLVEEREREKSLATAAE